MEVMETKRCLFCDDLVKVKRKGGCEWFIDCVCAPGESYGLREGSYEQFRLLSHSEKRGTFPIMSAYIREQTDCDEKVVISYEERQAILQSPQIPVTSEEKGVRLLRYLHRHTSGPGEPVVISQFSQSHNLTYSLNLQELVYITEKLKEEGYIERIGSTFKLTEKGWVEAANSASGRALMPCYVLLGGSEESIGREWLETVFPRLIQLGYAPKFLEEELSQRLDPKPIEAQLQSVSSSKLLIADVSEPNAELWLRVGFAIGNEIPVLWTCKSASDDQQLPLGVRPFYWDDTESLVKLVQKVLTKE
ncbi:MarR family transcriptional regulator [Paenibacillus montanisoli]|uniref:Uncharacterized protein n=1 Tax=Paenibacillus montanisoli TaxID=2081970 RepID=A0A328U911_9BACL|nr:MarR family transcriptional regulator [Paenibacillus montanisoli]RAP78293.1 hypothetical protein DL346_07650 [Paenibacillus montanisoli]